MAMISVSAGAQSLVGAWEGTYTDEEYNYLNIRNDFTIQLYFQLNSDGTYSIYSTSYFYKGKQNESKIICLLNYQLVGTDSIYLEEVKEIQAGDVESSCFQRMKLKIDDKKKRMFLTGTWDSASGLCSKGTIRFQKKK
jgi:hypothetical protein